MNTANVCATILQKYPRWKPLVGLFPAFTALFFAVSQLSTGAVVCQAASSPATSGYEIPLGELQKVKKERPAKKERRKKKSDTPEERKTYEAVAAPEQDAQAPAATAPVATQQNSGSAAKSGETGKSTASIAVHHDPYSYVVTGKRTVVQAIISSANTIQSAYCRFRAGKDGAYARVPMATAPGTYFTYTATLPALEAASSSLNYIIVAVDAAGNEIQSQEYVVAVKATTVVPGWQIDQSTDTLKVTFENKEKPIAGFADKGISE